MSDTQLHADFIELFDGRRDAVGTGAGPIERRALTVGDYERHLAGEGDGLGVFPLLDDGTVRFAAIDLDEPDFELARSMQRLIPSPSWIERSRSGNAHVWAFFSGPCPAWAVRSVLRFATEAVNRRDVEIFPKQDRVREGGVGNFINLPYFGDSRPILQDIEDLASPDDLGLMPTTVGNFVRLALGSRHDPAVWVARARTLGAQPPEERDDATEFGTQPAVHRCAVYMLARRLSNPVTRGARHQAAFALSKMLLNYRDATVEEAWTWLADFNDAMMPPLERSELRRTFRNALDGRFTSTGCDDPLLAPYVDPDCPIANA